MRTIKKIAIANRGEIAKRIILTCQEMGLKTVLLYATGDTKNEAFRLADQKVCIGPADPLKSYLNIQENILGALGAGAQALHPGYGFLSENPDFAKQCQQQGLIFIGPGPKSLAVFGNKITAKTEAQKAGLPVLKTELIDSENTLLKKSKKLSYPVMLKASLGGGGRGLRLANNKEELKQQWPVVKLEALKSFNNQEIFVEQYLTSAKHIELQFFVSADKELYILGDRDCSVQRRHQKIIEEAPSSLPKSLKKQMEEAVRALLLNTDYQGAGTVEFLVQDNQFYFLEVNTRLQVEHTVTEFIFGIDLIKAQILTAMGQPAFFLDKELKPKGHSIQCRICAEDIYQNFLPFAGELLFCQWPQGLNVRVDTCYQTGDKIPVFYDSLIAKIIVLEDTRVRAIEKMKTALKNTILFGLPTNINFLLFLFDHIDFINNKIHIHRLKEIYLLDWKQTPSPPLPKDFIQYIFKNLKNTSSGIKANQPVFNPWSYFSKKN